MPLRRLFQIRLRTLLAIMFAVALATIWYGARWREEHRRHSAIQYLTDRGGTVRVMPSFDGAQAEVVFDAAKLRFAAATPAGKPQLTLEDFEQLRLVPRLTSLAVEGDLLTSEALAGIATLDGLRRLEISHAPLDDEQLQLLAPLTHLRELDLEATQVTDDGVGRLCAQLPNLVVNDD